MTYATGGLTPISKLTPFMGNKWRIKCRIAKKNDRRTWRNDRGEGYLLNVELVDEEGGRI